MSYSTAFSQAIVTTVYVADKIRQGKFEYVPTSAISKSLNLKVPTLVKIIHQLSRAGIMETREGKSGGVRLAISAEKVTLLMLFEAIESQKPLFQIHLNLKATGSKPDKVKKELRHVLGESERAMKSILNDVTIEQYLNKVNQ